VPKTSKCAAESIAINPVMPTLSSSNRCPTLSSNNTPASISKSQITTRSAALSPFAFQSLLFDGVCAREHISCDSDNWNEQYLVSIRTLFSYIMLSYRLIIIALHTS
jgi:hypothetical protein